MALLDAFGRPVEIGRLASPLATPTGFSGARGLQGPHPWPGLTPARLLGILRQAEDGDAEAYYALAEEAEEKDLHYLGVLTARKRQVAQVPISVEPADETPGAAEHARFIEAWLARDTIEDELFALLDAIGKGHAILEILWARDGRAWRCERLLWRDPRWFRFSRADGDTLLLRDPAATATEGLPLPPYKFIVHRHPAKSGLAVRCGLARTALTALLLKNFALKGWVSFVELYGQPLRLGRYGAGANEDDRRTLLRAVADIGADAAAIIPDTMQIEFVSNTGGSKTAAGTYGELCAYLDQQISKAVLGQTTTTDAVSGGHAVAREHRMVQEDIERADCKLIAATLNQQLIRPLIDLNFGPPAAYPRLVIGREEEVDAPTIVEALKTLVPMGFRCGQADVRRLLDLPEPDAGEDVLQAPTPAPAVDAAPPGKTQPKPPERQPRAAKPSTQSPDPSTAAAKPSTQSPDPSTAAAEATAAAPALLSSPPQPRVPKGSPKGGEWTRSRFVPLPDSRTFADVVDLTHTDGPITPRQAEAVESYVKDPRPINRPLRHRGQKLSAEAAADRQHLDDLMARSRLTRDVVVYRGLPEPGVLFGKADPRSLIGKEVGDPGFKSASLDVGLAAMFASGGLRNAAPRPTLLEIHAPAGTRALFVDALHRQLGYNGDRKPKDVLAEEEVLFARRTVSRVKDVRHDPQGFLRVTMEIVRQD